jgi:hypothetical protein
MGWVSLRLFVANVIPGFIPMLAFFAVMSNQLEFDFLTTTGAPIALRWPMPNGTIYTA